MRVEPHLLFDGRCREAFQIYAATLGGKLVAALTYGDTPMSAQTPAEWRDKIAHARLDIGAGLILGADAPPGRYQAPVGSSLVIEVDTQAEAERIFSALADKGTIEMPLQETFWSHGFGTCTDRFGISWMINHAKPLELAASATQERAR